MKKFVLGLSAVVLMVSLVGCGHKKEEAVNMEGLSGVVTDNAASVADQGSGNVAVIVDNAQAMVGDAVSGAEDAAQGAAAVLKPTGKQIQQALKNAGFYSGKIDGEIGPKTKKAIEAFQAQHGLKADGKVGPKTWKALSASLNKMPEVANPSGDAQAVGQ